MGNCISSETPLLVTCSHTISLAVPTLQLAPRVQN